MRRSAGFTIIELLVVVAIIGILAAIALPRFGNTKEKSVDSAAKSDLRNAMTAQEAYFAEKSAYAPALSNLALTTSTGVTIGGSGSAAGYRMSTKHAASTRTWAVEVGSGSSLDGTIR